MGYEAACRLKVGGKISTGVARLEHKALLFRGPDRLVIPLSTVSSATSHSGVLRVRFSDRVAEFEIGEQAAKWADRITNPPSRLDKLGIKPGMSVALVRFDDEQFATEVRARNARVVRGVPTKVRPVDAIFFRVNRREELPRLPSLAAALPPDGAIWLLRPKGQKSITESDTMAAGRRAGLVDVKVVSFSDSLSAEKFVIPLSRRKRLGAQTARPRQRQLGRQAHHVRPRRL